MELQIRCRYFRTLDDAVTIRPTDLLSQHANTNLIALKDNEMSLDGADPLYFPTIPTKEKTVQCTTSHRASLDHGLIVTASSSVLPE